MSQSPLGISYNGPVNGNINNELIQSIKQLEKQLQLITGQALIGKFISGAEIINTPEYAQNIINDYLGVKPEIGLGAEKPKENDTEKPKDNNLVLQFKTYLAQKGLYKGNVTDPNIDEELINALKTIEINLSTVLTNYLNKPPNSAVGLIWTGSEINPDTSPEDIENAIRWLAKKVTKKSDALIDAWQKPSIDNPIPTAFNSLNNPIGYESPAEPRELPDPLDNQRQGVMVNKIPASLEVENTEIQSSPPTNERIEEIRNLINNTNNPI